MWGLFERVRLFVKKENVRKRVGIRYPTHARDVFQLTSDASMLWDGWTEWACSRAGLTLEGGDVSECVAVAFAHSGARPLSRSRTSLASLSSIKGGQCLIQSQTLSYLLSV